MCVDLIVCLKQVVDPEAPLSTFRVDNSTKTALAGAGLPPVANGFDENALEAALRIKDAIGGSITVLSVGDQFESEVMKKPLAMGADTLILVRDPAYANLDSFATARVLAAAIEKIGRYDLILCGRQASDWDNAQVPLALSEILALPCVTLARSLKINEAGIIVHRVLTDGYEVVEANIPALVTVSNELGEPRFPTLRGIMAASRTPPQIWNANDIGLKQAQLNPLIEVTELIIPSTDKDCEFIEGNDLADAGEQLALRLREENLI